jgi:glycosyltransferase involved in cell wall biosynthesis
MIRTYFYRPKYYREVPVSGCQADVADLLYNKKMEKVAVLIPCYNEEKTIARVVSDFRQQLPDADIYVYDNNSTDNTVVEAIGAGAIVRYEKRQGKGNVVRRMFAEVEADIYVMVDGDDTYPADTVKALIAPVVNGDAEMVIGSRLHPSSQSMFKPLNRIGNRLFLVIVNLIFRGKITDLLSGYRAFSRDIVRRLPILSRGFEIETEITIASLERNCSIVEIPVDLTVRPEGSKSKIKIWRDGLLILSTIFAYFRDYKPLTAFGLIGFFVVIAGIIPGVIVINEFLNTGLISRIPSAILAVGLVLTGFTIIFTGLVLHAISRRFQALDCQLYNYMRSGDRK